MGSHLRSNVVAYLALFVALGGTSYAAIKLPANSVKAKQIAAGAVSSSEVRNGSLLRRDFKSGQLPAGPRGAAGAAGPAGQAGPQGSPGAKGDKGDKGDPGTARAYALVTPDGNVVEAQSKGITDEMVSLEATSAFCFRDLGFTPKAAVATIDYADTPNGDREIALVEVAPDGTTVDCTSGATIEVATADTGSDTANPTFEPFGFYIFIEG